MGGPKYFFPSLAYRLHFMVQLREQRIKQIAMSKQNLL